MLAVLSNRVSRTSCRWRDSRAVSVPTAPGRYINSARKVLTFRWTPKKQNIKDAAHLFLVSALSMRSRKKKSTKSTSPNTSSNTGSKSGPRATAAKMPCAFLTKLPLEIRREVYRHLLCEDDALQHRFCVPKHAAWSWYQLHSWWPQADTAILRTCHQIHDEATDMLYGSNSFEIGPGHGEWTDRDFDRGAFNQVRAEFQMWLNKIGARNAARISHISFSWTQHHDFQAFVTYTDDNGREITRASLMGLSVHFKLTVNLCPPLSTSLVVDTRMGYDMAWIEDQIILKDIAPAVPVLGGLGVFLARVRGGPKYKPRSDRPTVLNDMVMSMWRCCVDYQQSCHSMLQGETRKMMGESFFI